MKFLCIGRNYADHIAELGNARPDEPVLFLKPDTAQLKGNAPFFHPEFSKNIQHEVEVIIRISKEGKYIDPKFAGKYYDAVGLGIDFTARDLQEKLRDKGLPWDIAKGFNHSAAVSEFILKEELGDLNQLNFHLNVNGEKRQEGNTSMMLWKIDEVVSALSQYFLLKKGDIIFTGTPKGVQAVKTGDKLEGWLEGTKLLDFEVK